MTSRLENVKYVDIQHKESFIFPCPWIRKRNESYHVTDLGVDGGKVFKMNLNQYAVKYGLDSLGSEQGPVPGSC
jgi:hypothetical protein